MSEVRKEPPLGTFASTDSMSYAEAVAESKEREAKNKYMECAPLEAEPGSWKVTTRLRPDWRRLCNSDRVDRPVKKGERFLVVADTEARVLTRWRAPATGAGTAMVPAQTILVADEDQSADAPGFSVVPENREQLESVLVSPAERKAQNYDGYWLSFVLDDIGPKLQSLNELN